MLNLATKGKRLPSRMVIYGEPGTGKTSFASQSPNPVFIMLRGETGLLTLMDNGIVGDTPHFEVPAANLSTFKQYIDDLIKQDHDRKTLIIDALTGLESIIFDFVIGQHFKGSKKSFDAYGAGPSVAVDEVEMIFNKLDELREKRQMGIILISHAKVGKFKNPEGLDYNQYKVDCEEKTWGVVNKWADIVCFIRKQLIVNEDGLKRTGRLGDMVMHTEGTAAFAAKNRLNLPTEIYLGDSHISAWKAFSNAVKESRNSNKSINNEDPATQVA